VALQRTFGSRLTSMHSSRHFSSCRVGRDDCVGDLYAPDLQHGVEILHHRLAKRETAHVARFAGVLIRRCQRSSSTVHPFCFTFNQRRVAPPSYALASSFAT